MGKNPKFAPAVSIPGLPAQVGVRDVAMAHVRALQLPPRSSERFLLGSGVDYFEDGLTNLRSRGVKGLGSEGAKCDRSKHFSLDVTEAEKKLGLSFKPFATTVDDVWDRMCELKFIEG